MAARSGMARNPKLGGCAPSGCRWGSCWPGCSGCSSLEGGDVARRGLPGPPPSVATIAARVEALRGLRFDSRPVPQRVSPAAGAPRRARGPRPLLPRGAPQGRRGGAQAARADRAGRRPALDLGLGVRRGRRRLLRPALASACGSSSGDDARRAGRDRARPRAHARARGPALRAGAGGGRERRRRAGPARARRGHGDARHAAVPAAPHRRRAGARRALGSALSRPGPTCRSSSRTS